MFSILGDIWGDISGIGANVFVIWDGIFGIWDCVSDICNGVFEMMNLKKWYNWKLPITPE